MTNAIETVAATVAGEIKAFRTAAVTSENRATPFARSILAALLSGLSTKDMVTSMVIHAFGNPKSPAGKPIAKLSGSGDHIVGWGATRKTVASVFDVFDNVDADKVGAAAIRPLVVAFVLSDDGSAKSLRALVDAVKVAIAAHAATLQGDNSDAVEENKANDTAPATDAAPAPAVLSLTDRINALNVAIANDPAALLADDTDAAIAALMDTIKAAYALAMEEEEQVQQAA